VTANFDPEVLPVALRDDTVVLVGRHSGSAAL